MSTRERWIVYPLLFLTLGIVMRDKIIPPKILQVQGIAAEQIRCSQLQVDMALCNRLQAGAEIVEGTVKCEDLVIIGPKGRPTVFLSTDPRTKGGMITSERVQCGALAVIGPEGRPTVLVGTDPKARGGLIETFSPGGVPQVRIPPINPGAPASPLSGKGNAMPPEKPTTPSPPSSKEPSDRPAR
jgi:hypothetical protein